MSGGLDSTWSARKLLSEGHTVEGAILLMHDHTALQEARSSASALGIPLREIDCRERFRETVMASFAAEYLAGRTPNPCIICNSEVKFQCLSEYAEANGFDAIATGHYAKVEYRDGRYGICRGEDSRKDQSYVLWRLNQKILSRLVLPLGNEKKEQIREAAKCVSLAAADREESQEICFIPDHDYASFITKNYGSSKPGNFVDLNGNILGRHRGFLHYTVGQRRGLGVALGERMFVVELRAKDNSIVLAPSGNSGCRSFTVDGLIFSGIQEPSGNCVLNADVKIRYLAASQKAQITLCNGIATVKTEEKLSAATPGQSAVFYDMDRILFGGIIRTTDSE